MEIRLFLGKMSEEDDDGRKNIEGCDSRQFDVLGSQAGFGPNNPSFNGPIPLGCQCKIIGGKVYYGPEFPRPTWMQD